MRKTKIICTIGPATWSEEMLEKMMLAGMDIARFNMSHAWKPEEIANIKIRMQTVQRLREKHGLKTEIALDTKGPDIRIGKYAEGKVTVAKGQKYKFYFGEHYKTLMGDINGVFVPYEKLLRIVKVGAQLALNDGHVVMTITDIANSIITCRVDAGGLLKDNKSLAAPGFDLELPFISPEDETDFKMGIAVGVDWIMASDLNKVQDVIDLKKFLKANKAKKIKIMAKIEDLLGLKNLDAIIANCDAVMVARGGLGTDIGFENLPPMQKLIVAKTREGGKKVAVATEMLESMTEKPNPTRAEVTDVCNAVWDGANWIMLSGESAAGKYPVECVEFMVRAITVAEKHKEYFRPIAKK